MHKFAINNKADEIKPGILTLHHAKKGEGEAFHSIGNKYYDRKDYSKAMAWYRLPADKKYPASNINIGNMYHSGEGVPTDDLVALEWYIKAAKHKNKAAFTIIGHFFENGYGTGVNKLKALEWYYRIDKDSDNVNRLNNDGIQLDKGDKGNLILFYYLIGCLKNK
jgi:TPR repeat protein